MSRKKLTSQELNWLELLELKLQLSGSDPGSHGGEGSVYMHSGNHRLMVHNGTAFAGLAWASEVSGAYTDENARDALAAALVGGTGITITPNDGADTITVATTITQYNDEAAQDAVGAMLVDSSEIDFTYTDATPALTASLITASVALSKIANIATARVLGRVTASSGVIEELTQAQVRTFLGTGWIGSSEITDASIATGDLANGAVTYAKMQDVSATSRVLGRITAGAGDPEELTGANVRTILGTLDADTLGGDSKTTIINAVTAAIVGTAPGTLDTLGELSDALADDAAFSTTVTTALAARVQAFSATIGDNSTTAIAVTHSLGTRDIIASVRDVTTHEFYDCDVVATSTTVATFTFGVAPATNSLRVTIHAKP
jgi:hypothetical protein